MAEAKDHLPNRLDLIESNMQTIQEALLSVISTVEENSVAIGELTNRIDRVGVQVEENSVAIGKLTNRIDRVDAQLETLSGTTNQLATLMVQFSANAEADRSEFRRIWEYLLNQQPNGR